MESVTRSILAILVIVVIGYAVICVWMYARQRQLIYFPTPPASAVGIDPLWVDSAGERVKVWPLNDGAADAVIYFGGNAEDVLYAAPLFESVFPDRAVYLVNYRGYGGSSGSPSEHGFYADGLNVFDAVGARHDRVSVVGRSIGSTVATHVAARRPAHRLAVVTPIDSVEALARHYYPLLPVSLLLKDRFRAVDDAPRVSAPTLAVIAAADEIVPRANSLRLVDAFEAAPVEVAFLEGAGHNDISGNPDYAETLRAFFLAGAD